MIVRVHFQRKIRKVAVKTLTIPEMNMTHVSGFAVWILRLYEVCLCSFTGA
jgi:hypothetical protein